MRSFLINQRTVGTGNPWRAFRLVLVLKMWVTTPLAISSKIFTLEFITVAK